MVMPKIFTQLFIMIIISHYKLIIEVMVVVEVVEVVVVRVVVVVVGTVGRGRGWKIDNLCGAVTQPRSRERALYMSSRRY